MASFSDTDAVTRPGGGVCAWLKQATMPAQDPTVSRIVPLAPLGSFRKPHTGTAGDGTVQPGSVTSSDERGVAVALTAVRATFTVVRPALSDSPPVDRTSSTTPLANSEYVAPEIVPCELFLGIVPVSVPPRDPGPEISTRVTVVSRVTTNGAPRSSSAWTTTENGRPCTAPARPVAGSVTERTTSEPLTAPPDAGGTPAIVARASRLAVSTESSRRVFRVTSRGMGRLVRLGIGGPPIVGGRDGRHMPRKT